MALPSFPSFAFRLLLIFLLIPAIDRNSWTAGTLGTTNVSITFQEQFTNIEELAISSFHSDHVTSALRTDSLALEDLSHSVKSRSGELGVPSEVPVQFYDLSKSANAVADALEQFYIKVAGMVEL